MDLFLFVRWYYREGIQNGSENVWNLLRLVLFRFNILELTGTLVAPWKRDVEYRSWRGFHPFKELVRFIGNILSRFLGLCVRLPVVIFGITFFLVASVIVTGIFALFLAAPVLPIFGSLVYWLLDVDFMYTQWTYLASGIGVLFAGICFLLRAPEMTPLQETDFFV